jgi:hypothetical protein
MQSPGGLRAFVEPIHSPITVPTKQASTHKAPQRVRPCNAAPPLNVQPLGTDRLTRPRPNRTLAADWRRVTVHKHRAGPATGDCARCEPQPDDQLTVFAASKVTFPPSNITFEPAFQILDRARVRHSITLQRTTPGRACLYTAGSPLCAAAGGARRFVPLTAGRYLHSMSDHHPVSHRRASSSSPGSCRCPNCRDTAGPCLPNGRCCRLWPEGCRRSRQRWLWLGCP